MIMAGTKSVVLEPIEIWTNALYTMLLQMFQGKLIKKKCDRIIAGSLAATKNTWQSWATSQEIAKLVKEPGLGLAAKGFTLTHKNPDSGPKWQEIGKMQLSSVCPSNWPCFFEVGYIKSH